MYFLSPMPSAGELQQQQAKIDQLKSQTRMELEKRRKQLQEQIQEVDEQLKKLT